MLESKKTLIEQAELGLAQKVKEGNLDAIIFTLETLGKKDGYSKEILHSPILVTKLRLDTHRQERWINNFVYPFYSWLLKKK